MPRTYRSPTVEETRKLEASRKLMAEGIEGEKDILSRFMPTMAKGARDDMKRAEQIRNSVSERAREGEAYNQAGYAKGGKVSASKRADGCAQRGKTKGRMV